MWGILFIISTIYSFYYSKKLAENAKNPKGELLSHELLHVIIPELFSPILAGAIYYYSWKKKLPTRAAQANKYSWVIFGVMLLLGFVAFWARVKQGRMGGYYY